jgi:hypothetical protein
MERAYSTNTFVGTRGREIMFNYLKGVRNGIKQVKFKGLHKSLYVGGWHDTKTNRVVLDVSERYYDVRKAKYVGRQRKQDGIFNLTTGETIDLRGKRGKSLHVSGYYGRRDGRGTGADSRQNDDRAGPLELKKYTYEGLALSRKPTPLEEQIDLKAIKAAFDEGEQTLQTQFEKLRKQVLDAAIAGIITLDPADYHSLVIDPPKKITQQLLTELQRIYMNAVASSCSMSLKLRVSKMLTI